MGAGFLHTKDAMSLFPEYLESLELSPSHHWQDPKSENHIQRQSMNKLVMDYLITEGFKDAAEKFRDEAGIRLSSDEETNLNTMDDRIRIRECIQTGRIGEATSLVHQLHPELLDDDRYLFFHLQQQQLIELIRENRIEDALKFASEQLAERGEEDASVLNELERTLALLAFEDPHLSPFSDLLSHSHRQKIASELNAAILKAEHTQQNSQPKLATVLKLLLWSQFELDKKGVRYNRLTDLSTGRTEDAAAVLHERPTQ